VLRKDKRHGVWFPKAVAAVVARAYLTHPWKAIDRFCEIINLDGSDMTSMPRETWELAAVMFRDEVKKERHVKARSDEEYAWIYRTTEQALWNFLRKVTPSCLAQADRELFPLKTVSSLTMELENNDRIMMVEQRKEPVAAPDDAQRAEAKPETRRRKRERTT